MTKRPQNTMQAVQKLSAMLRKAGYEVAGCSYCAVHRLKRGKAPCPFCGRVVSGHKAVRP